MAEFKLGDRPYHTDHTPDFNGVEGTDWQHLHTRLENIRWPIADMRSTASSLGISVLKGPVGMRTCTLPLFLHIGQRSKISAGSSSRECELDGVEQYLSGGSSPLECAHWKHSDPNSMHVLEYRFRVTRQVGQPPARAIAELLLSRSCVSATSHYDSESQHRLSDLMPPVAFNGTRAGPLLRYETAPGSVHGFIWAEHLRNM